MSSTAVPYALFGLAMGCAIGANIFYHLLISRCNQRLSDKEQISRFWGRPGVVSRNIRTYRELFPDGRLHVHHYLLVGLAGFFFVLGLALR
jgi:hypothetical protein